MNARFKATSDKRVFQDRQRQGSHCQQMDSRLSRRGLSLLELTIAATIVGIIVSLAAPSFQRAVEQSRADIAGANLRAIWAAQRCYWLDTRTFADDLTTLQSLGLLDTAVSTSSENYVYSIIAADASGFSATAVRNGSSKWGGTLTIDETGVLSGQIVADGETDIVPGFQ